MVWSVLIGIGFWLRGKYRAASDHQRTVVFALVGCLSLGTVTNAAEPYPSLLFSPAFDFSALTTPRALSIADEPELLIASRLGARRAAACLDSMPTSAPPCACNLRSQDQFWLIRTGHLPCLGCEVVTEPSLAVAQYHCEAGWTDRTFADLRRADDNAITIFYVPGNRVANDEALRRAWMVYDWLQSAATEQPLRLIVWSWPSDKVPGQLRDFRTKAARTSTESVYLAWTLRQLDPQARISMLGYSYGARISAGALHVSAGGGLEGASLIQDDTRPTPARAVFFASASHNYWLLPGEFHGQAISQIERMLVLYNSCDPALKHYRLIEKCERGDALGFTGLVTTAGSDALAARLRQCDVADQIGKTHDELSYLQSPHVMAEARRYLLWNELSE